MNSFYIYKSIGDIIYSIPAIQEYGGGSIYTGLPIDEEMEWVKDSTRHNK